MSSVPFCVGLPIVDELKPDAKNVILRSINREDAWSKIRKLQNQMSRKDLIKVWEIGMRPDKPIPVAMHFCEITIRPGEAEAYAMRSLVWGWTTVVTGLKDCYGEIIKGGEVG